MDTKIIQVKNAEDPQKELADAGRIIRDGGLVAFPTETVYGLGGDAKNPRAAKAIYAAKGRPSDNPLIVHIAEIGQMEEIAEDIPEAAYLLARAFWPGPMTLILKKNHVIPDETTGGLSTVAVRLPDHPIARALIRESGCMIAAPSANLSGRPSPTAAVHVIEDLGGRVDCIIDGGSSVIGLESTIIDLTEEIPTVLRPGYISLDEVIGVTKTARMDPGLSEADDKTPPKAPGMRYRHYAPKGSLTIVEGQRQPVIEKINALCEEAVKVGKKTAVICTDETAECYHYGDVYPLGSFSDEEKIARNLYAILRRLDETGRDVIYSESFDTPHIGTAVMNRLLKAAGHQVIEAKNDKKI